MAAGRQPPSRDDILETALAALAEDDTPPDEDCLGWQDPDCAPPPELAGLSTPELDELIAAQPAPVAETGPAGFLPRDRSGGGYGFADGGELDVLDPGVPLAGFAADAHARLAALTDDELIGVLRAWRRQTSWAQARELAAVAELARRRPAERTRARGRRVCRQGQRVHRRRGRYGADPDRPRRRGRAGPGPRHGRPPGYCGGAGDRRDRPAPGKGDDHRGEWPGRGACGGGGGADPAPRAGDDHRAAARRGAARGTGRRP